MLMRPCGRRDARENGVDSAGNPRSMPTLIFEPSAESPTRAYFLQPANFILNADSITNTFANHIRRNRVSDCAKEDSQGPEIVARSFND